MVEIEQEEFERLKGIETAYGELQATHQDLNERHNKLKDDYIEVCKSQRQTSGSGNTDDFSQFCKDKFGK